MKKKILKWFGIKHCTQCGSVHIDAGYWIRGWNDLCNQGCGDTGDRCYNCGHIVWKHTLDEYKQMLPKWCRAYERP
jgi:hypothetical protein